LQDGVKDSGDGAEPSGFTIAGAAQAVKVPEQLVRSVDQVDDHRFVFIVGRLCSAAAAFFRRPAFKELIDKDGLSVVNF
jgi:hypothetical protein